MQDSTPPANTFKRQPTQDMEIVVMALADVIDHATKLQAQSDGAVQSLIQASNHSIDASDNLIAAAKSLQNELTVQVAAVVGKRFDAAVAAAGESIAKDLKDRTANLINLAKSLEQTVRQAQSSMQEQSQAIEQRLIMYASGGAVLGAVLAGVCILLATYLGR